MELLEIRKKIDIIDDKIVELFIQRLDIMEDISKEKSKNNIKIKDLKRELQILEKISNKSTKYEKYTKELFEKIIQLSTDYQSSLRDI